MPRAAPTGDRRAPFRPSRAAGGVGEPLRSAPTAGTGDRIDGPAGLCAAPAGDDLAAGGSARGVHGNVGDTDTLGHFLQLTTFEIGDGEPPGGDGLRRSIAGGKAVWTVQELTSHASHWEQVCAIERDLLAERAQSGWTLVAATAEGCDEFRGWLVYGDRGLVPLGPKAQKEHGVDIAAAAPEEWTRVAVVCAAAPAPEESAIVLNRQIRDACSS